MCPAPRWGVSGWPADSRWPRAASAASSLRKSDCAQFLGVDGVIEMGNGGKITSSVCNQKVITFMKSRLGPSGCLLLLCVCLLVSLLFYCG